jgi:organic hydroperoxide reductase OsmC/OhrA
METKVFTYTTDLEWIGDRRSVVRSGDRPQIVVAPPVDFPSGHDGEWSPEHLFLGALQSCTMLSFVAHCAHRGLEIVSFESHAEGTLQRREEDRRYAFTAVDLTVQVKMAGGHAAAAREVIDRAERDCFISASTTADVRTDWRIIE